jgi:hypothetical protein
MRNYSLIVSCHGYTQSSHVEWETIRKQFPAAMMHSSFLLHLSFRAKRSGVEKSPAELFPVGVLYNRPMSNRKLSANSFLSLCCTIGPCRTGNFSQTVSCRGYTQSFHAGQETIRKQFPAAVIRNRSMSDRKLLRKQFPVVINHIRVPPDILIPPWTLRFSGPAEYPP